VANAITGPACYRHPTAQRTARCEDCGLPICDDCIVRTSSGIKCPACVEPHAQPASANEPLPTPKVHAPRESRTVRLNWTNLFSLRVIIGSAFTAFIICFCIAVAAELIAHKGDQVATALGYIFPVLWVLGWLASAAQPAVRCPACGKAMKRGYVTCPKCGHTQAALS